MGRLMQILSRWLAGVPEAGGADATPARDDGRSDERIAELEARLLMCGWM